MLIKSQNEKLWDQVLSQPDLPDSLLRGIKESLLKYKIDCAMWMVNLECLARWDCLTDDGISASIHCAEIIRRFNRWEMPLYMQDWFLAGFPDVWLWFDAHPNMIKKLEEYEDDSRYFTSEGTLPAGYNLLVELRIKESGLHPSLTYSGFF